MVMAQTAYFHLRVHYYDVETPKSFPDLGRMEHLRSLCLQIECDHFGSKLYSFIAKYLSNLQKLAIAHRCVQEPYRFLGKPILRYLRKAKHLIELRLFSKHFRDIELNEFYDSALEIIESRENKLPLTIYHRGDTIVRDNNNNLLRLLHYEYTPLTAYEAKGFYWDNFK